MVVGPASVTASGVAPDFLEGFGNLLDFSVKQTGELQKAEYVEVGELLFGQYYDLCPSVG